MSGMHAPSSQDQEIAQRRRRARRTALWLAGIALAVYVGFLLSGVLKA